MLEFLRRWFTPPPPPVDRIGLADAECQRRLDGRAVFCSGDFEQQVLPDFSTIPGQISEAEGKYLHWLLSNFYTGRGAVVEVGTWLGLSTVHLAQGLKESGVASPKLHSYDRFIWDGWAHNQKSGLDLEKGADFQPYFEENICDYRDVVAVTNADYKNIQWNGGPIEILFLDAPKNAFGFHATFKAFGPHLIPGESVVVFQDYLHPPSYDLAFCLHRIRHKLECCHVVHDGGTVSFRLLEALDKSDWALAALKFNKLSAAEINAAWDDILAPLPEPAWRRFCAGRAIHLCDNGHVAEACAAMEALDFDNRMRRVWTFWGRQQPFQDRLGPLFEVFYGRFPEARG